MSKLKPCPFCGGEAEIESEWLYCTECGIGYETRVGSVCNVFTLEDTIKKWNTRKGENECQ